MIQRIIDKDAHIHHVTDGASQSRQEDKPGIQMIYQHLMNGVSFMVPFIVVGGLLMAIALTIGGEATSKV